MFRRMQVFVFFYFFMLVSVFAQTFSDDESWKVYDDSEVALIEITMNPADLDYMYDNPESDSMHLCTVYFKNAFIDDTIHSVGIRIRGNSSREAKKKSFKLSFNTFVEHGEFYTLEKINLNGDHNDPTIIRSKLCWDLYKKMNMISPRAAHAEVYINGDYYGLYISTEHIDNKFIKKNFENHHGNLWKCNNSAGLEYLGDDPEEYKYINSHGERAYELKKNKEDDDYSLLTYLIDVINNTPDSLFYESLLDIISIEDLLKYYAFDILSGNWDDYWYGSNNYYLYYHPKENKFRLIPFDYDNTFGIDFDEYDDFATRNIYNFTDGGHQKVFNDRVLNTPALRNLLTHFVEYYSEHVFDLSLWESKADSIKEMITPYAERDNYKCWGFTNLDFHQSYDSTGYFFENSIKLHRSIKEFVNVRNSSISEQINYLDTAPIVIYDVNLNKKILFYNDTLSVNASVFHLNDINNIYAIVNYDNDVEESYPFAFNPSQEVGEISGADRWTVKFATSGNWKIATIKVHAEDNNGNISIYPQNGIVIERVASKNSPLKINELMSKNDSVIHSDIGKFSDWIELYNSGESVIDLSGKYLTDDKGKLTKWEIPNNISIDADDFLVFWCDNDTAAGSLHTNFKLNSDGEFLALVDNDGITILDSIFFPKIPANTSYGRVSGIDSVWNIFRYPTPNEKNRGEITDSTKVILLNEFMADNLTVIKDENDEFDDWVEIYNPQDSTVELSGKFFTDDITFPGKWMFPEGTSINSKDYLLVWCDDNEEQGRLHTNFKLSKKGEFLGIFSENAATLIDSVSFGPQKSDISFARMPNGSDNWAFSLPSPGAINFADLRDKIFINEILASNKTIMADSAGEFDDWIELYNPTEDTLNLSKLYLTDDENNLTKWSFGNTDLEILPKEYKIIWCDNDTVQGRLHTNFKLSGKGEFLALVSVDGSVIIDSVSFGKQKEDVALARIPDGFGNWVFTHPTPGSTNYLDFNNKLFINELLALNKSTIADSAGEFDDWIELYNPTEDTLNITGLFLTDDKTNLTKWRFKEPNLEILPEEHKIVWCDNDTEQGYLHTNFKLSSNGEFLALVSPDGKSIIDSLTFSKQYSDTSYSRSPDGSKDWAYVKPTPGNQNIITDVNSSTIPTSYKVDIYPNPFNPSTTILFQIPERVDLKLAIYNLLGENIYSKEIKIINPGTYSVHWNGVNRNGNKTSSGIYLVTVEAGKFRSTKKIILLK